MLSYVITVQKKEVVYKLFYRTIPKILKLNNDGMDRGCDDED